MMQSYNNNIQQPQTMSQVKGPQMNDRDMINETLSALKYMTDGYNVFAWEASHQALHNDVMELLVETHCQTRDVFNLMFRKGWYQAESEQKQKLQQTWQQYSSYQNQFPYNPGFVQ